MHIVCGYPVKSTWLKAIKAGNYVGWPMLTECSVQKYYPEATKTAKGHLNQTRKKVCSTKEKPAPLETCNTSQLHGKKVRDVYTKTYKIRKTMFSNQMDQFPMQSQQGNKYIMVMVEINSNTILIKPMNSCKDAPYGSYVRGSPPPWGPKQQAKHSHYCCTIRQHSPPRSDADMGDCDGPIMHVVNARELAELIRPLVF
jgi:hypothetical protein